MCVLMCNFVSYFVCVILCIFVFLCDILLPSGVINDDDSVSCIYAGLDWPDGRIMFSTCSCVRLSVRLFVRSPVTNL